MSANIAAIYGAQLFQADDKPLYRRAFASNIGILGFALVLAIGLYIHQRHRQRIGDILNAIMAKCSR
jgi:hypothetical protein